MFSVKKTPRYCSMMLRVAVNFRAKSKSAIGLTIRTHTFTVLLLILAVSIVRIPSAMAQNDTIRCALKSFSELAYRRLDDFNELVDEYVSILCNIYAYKIEICNIYANRPCNTIRSEHSEIW